MSDAVRPHLNVSHFAIGIQSPERLHEVVKVWTDDHSVEVVVSPTGRSWQVFVDGKTVKAGGSDE